MLNCSDILRPTILTQNGNKVDLKKEMEKKTENILEKTSSPLL